MILYHYYEHNEGPFKELTRAKNIDEAYHNTILKYPYSMNAQRSKLYLPARLQTEKIMYDMHINAGHKCEIEHPHYMCIGSCSFLLNFFQESDFLSIDSDMIDKKFVSVTYGDSLLSIYHFNDFNDNKEYRDKLYTLDDVPDLISKYGLPQEHHENNIDKYIEVQVWTDSILELPSVKSIINNY